jgi:hypothetical protein
MPNGTCWGSRSSSPALAGRSPARGRATGLLIERGSIRFTEHPILIAAHAEGITTEIETFGDEVVVWVDIEYGEGAIRRELAPAPGEVADLLGFASLSAFSQWYSRTHGQSAAERRAARRCGFYLRYRLAAA